MLSRADLVPGADRGYADFTGTTRTLRLRYERGFVDESTDVPSGLIAQFLRVTFAHFTRAPTRPVALNSTGRPMLAYWLKRGTSGFRPRTSLPR